MLKEFLGVNTTAKEEWISFREPSMNNSQSQKLGQKGADAVAHEMAMMQVYCYEVA